VLKDIVNINSDNTSRGSSVSSDVAAEQGSNASCSLTASDTAQRDEQATIDLKSCRAEAIGLSHTDETMENGQDHLAGVLPLNDGPGSDQVERTCSGTASVREQSPEAGIIDRESSHSSQVTMPSVPGSPPCPVEEIANQPRHQSFAVVVPPPPRKQQRIARTITRTAASERQSRCRQGSNGTHNSAKKGSVNVIKGHDEKQQCLKKKHQSVVRSLSSHQHSLSPALSESPHESQVILGRAILTVQRNGPEPAYFFTFVPDSTPQGSSSCSSTDGKSKPATSHPASAINTGNHRPYSSEENARLVRLREKEGISWAEIAERFPGRNASSLQAHYSTKLRPKTTSRFNKRQRRLRQE
jgi:hypothetical protein